MSVYSLLANAVRDPNGENNNGYEFIVGNGDLQQMSAQGRFLQQNGIDVGFRNVYPAVKTKEDVKKALKLMFEKRCSGWWNLNFQMVQEGVCTQAEFNEALKKL